MSRLIKQEHKRWAEAVVPANAPEVQREEMRKAFYSGYAACFASMMDDASLPGEMAEANMVRREDELKVFFALFGEQLEGEHKS